MNKQREMFVKKLAEDFTLLNKAESDISVMIIIDGIKKRVKEYESTIIKNYEKNNTALDYSG